MARTVYRDVAFDDLIYKLYVVCSDLITGQEVVLDKGLLRTSVLASGALPGIFSPVRMDEKYLVDGAILNRIPVSVLKEKGVRNSIVVNVTPQKDMFLSGDYAYNNSGWFKKIMLKNKRLKELITEPNILHIIARSFNLVNAKHSSLHLGKTDILIKPDIEQFEFFSFKDFDKIVEKGEESAEKTVSAIISAMRSS
jgi:NTE family protein